MEALVNMPKAGSRLLLRDVPEPEPRGDEAVVSVHSFSINLGEIALIRNRPEGWRPGQDIAGVVERPAQSGEGPRTGERVAALIEGAGWAERVAVPVKRLARVPDGVDLDQAAGLPMAGLTGLALVRRCGDVISRSMVVTGPSGGVGSLAVQLGKLASAEITAIARAGHEPWLSRLGAASVVPAIADANGRFDFILESVGRTSLEQAIALVRPAGRIICLGNSSAAKAAFDTFSFFGAENASVETFFSYRAMVPDEIGANLAYLLGLAASGLLEVHSTALNWEEAGSAIALLEWRGTRGKIVLTTTLADGAAPAEIAEAVVT